MLKTYAGAFLDSFYNPRIYRDAILRWQGFGGKYMALVAIVLAALVFSIFLMTIHTFEQTELPHFLDQVPSVTLQNGVIKVEGPQPVTIQSLNKKLTIIIDTNKSESELRDTKAQVGIGKDFVFFNANGQYQSTYLDQMKDKQKKIIIDKTNLKELWDTTLPAVKVVAVPFLIIGQFINMILESIVVAVCSYLVTAFMAEEFIFVTRMRLAALALTPANIISVGILMFFDHQTAPWFIILVATLYIYVMLVLMRRLPPAESIDIAA